MTRSLLSAELSVVSGLGRRPWLQMLIAAVLVTIPLLPALQAGLIWDDIHQIRESTTIRDWRRIPDFFRLNVIQAAGGDGINAEGLDIYRPLFMTALVGLYAINEADPFWFHAGSIVAHVLVCLMLWSLARRWLRSDGAAWVAVLLFAFHPVAAEAFLWPSAISDPMALLGLLGAALLLDVGRSAARPAAAWALATCAGLVLLAGLLSKEAMLAAVPAVGLWHYLRREVSWRHLLAPAGAVLVFLGLRTAALGGLEATGSGGEQRLLAIKHLPVLLLDGLRATVLMRPIGPRHLWFEYRELGWIASGLALALLLLLAVAVWLLRRRCPLLELGAGVLLLGLAPVALVSTVPGWGGFARYIYLPWAFGACAAVQLGRELWRRLAEREQSGARAAIVLLTLLLVGWLCLQQIGLRQALLVYSSQEELARSAVAIDPDGPPGQEWLANVFLEQGDLARALEHYRLAVAGDPELYRPRLNTAACLLHLNRPGEALEEIAGLEARHGMTVKSTLVAVRALLRLRRADEARARLARALEIAPDSPLLRQLEGELELVVPDGLPGLRQVSPG